MHAYRHEEWAALDADSEAALLARATAAMRSIGIEPRGFRPPGGGLTERTLALLAEHGYTYVSPAGEREGLLEGLAVLPFRWPLVDAYGYLPQFSGLRERYGAGPDPLTPEQMRDELMIAALDEHARPRHRGSSDAALSPLHGGLHGRAGLGGARSGARSYRKPRGGGRDHGERMDEAAAEMLELPAELTRAPQLDAATWMAP